MPFTISHIAAVVPLRNSKLSFSAMAIGSMSPDFSYIAALTGERFDGHSLLGALTFSLPVALAVWFLFDKFLVKAWSSVFPWLKSESARVPYPMILISALLGVFTHVVWDSFTHQHGWSVEQIAGLRIPVGSRITGTRPLHNWLQHLSSLFGFSVVAVALRHRILVSGRRWIGSRSAVLQSLTCFLVVVISICLPLFFRERSFFDSGMVEVRLFQLAIRLLAAAMFTSIVFPIARLLVDRWSSSAN